MAKKTRELTGVDKSSEGRRQHCLKGVQNLEVPDGWRARGRSKLTLEEE